MPGKNQSTAVSMIIREMMRHDSPNLESIAEASLMALKTVESKMAAVLCTHPIPLRATRKMLEDALPAERAAGRTVSVRLIQLQLRLLDEGKATAAGSEQDFEVFRSILDQHHIDF